MYAQMYVNGRRCTLAPSGSPDEPEEDDSVGEREIPNASTVRSTWAASLDLAAEGRPVAFRRDSDEFVLLPAALLRDVLRRAVPPPDVVAEHEGWSVLLHGHPVAADGATLDEALDDFVSALRDYADAWEERLHSATDHEHAAALVQLVALVDDDALMAWARSGTSVARSPAPAA
jgi:hypothetical protein